MQLTGIDTLPQAVQYINKLENEIGMLREQISLLLLKRFGRSSEQHDPGQQSLFAGEEGKGSAKESAAEAQEETQVIKSYTRKKGGRKALDPKIERREKIIDISEEEKTCACGGKLTQIGAETRTKVRRKNW